MFELKPISKDSIEAVLEKAVRYRLLNEPWEADSICRDVLKVDPENQQAVIGLILALTDQFGDELGTLVDEARSLARQLQDEYERAYYGGIICERQAKAYLHRLNHGGMAHGSLQEAMTLYEQAETVRPPSNEDAILRWNTCARMLMRHPELRPTPDDKSEPYLE